MLLQEVLDQERAAPARIKGKLPGPARRRSERPITQRKEVFNEEEFKGLPREQFQRLRSQLGVKKL